MASSRILDSRYFDKLAANRLEALSIKSDNIKTGPSGPSGPSGPVGPVGPSFLFSLLLKDATFTPNTIGGTLTFDLPLHSGDNVIMFSDRPFRQTSFISFNEFISAFTSDNSNNSFEKDPPNAVLVHSEEQRTYIVRYSSTDSSTVTFNLDLLAGETNVSLEVITGRMNLFVDSLNSNRIEQNILTGDNYAKYGEYKLAAEKYQLVGKYYTNIHNYEFAGKYYQLAGDNYQLAGKYYTNSSNYGFARENYELAAENYALAAGNYQLAAEKYINIANYELAGKYYELAGDNYTNIPNYDLAGKNFNLASKYYKLAGDNNLANSMYRLAYRNLNWNTNVPH